MKNTSYTENFVYTEFRNESALNAFLKTNIIYFEFSLYVLYSLIFLFGIFGNSVVIYVLMSSIFFDRNQKHRQGLILKEQTTIIGQNNSFRINQYDTPKKTANLGQKNHFYSLLCKLIKEKLTVTNFYLLNLAITDFLYVLFIPVLLCTMLTNKWLFGIFFCKVYFSIVYLCQCSSVFILVVLSIDRYLSVKYPLKTSTFRSDEIARIVIFMSWLLSFFFITPVTMYTEYQPSEGSCRMHWPEKWNYKNQTRFSEIANTYLAPLQLFNIYTFLLNYLIPVSIIVILYTQILSNLEKNSQKNTATNRSKSKRKSHKHITKMVLAIIICYITCWTPYWCYQIAIYVYNQIFKLEAPFLLVIISHFVQVIAYMSSALNPFIYSYMSEAFRTNLNSAFKNCCCQKRDDLTNYEMKEIQFRKDSVDCKLLKQENAMENRSPENKKVKSVSSSSTVRIESFSSVSNTNDKESPLNNTDDIKEENKNFLDDNQQSERKKSRLKFMSFSSTQPEPDPEPVPLERQTNSASNLETNKKSKSKIPIKKLTLLNTANSKLKLEINFHGINYFKK